jgi:hypothetical protein
MRIDIRVFAMGALATGVAMLSCSSSDSGPTGGPVSGPADTHCDLPDGGLQAQVTHLSTCNLPVQDAGPTVYGVTNYNSAANDDDCKYHVAFTATPVREKANVTFTVTATTLVDGQAATGANVIAEVYLNDTHPAPNSGQATMEAPGGVYTVGPIVFDSPGQWTVRFHLHSDCQDQTADSPHGHAAFFISVP